jgi:hypothetical protein
MTVDSGEMTIDSEGRVGLGCVAEQRGSSTSDLLTLIKSDTISHMGA